MTTPNVYLETHAYVPRNITLERLQRTVQTLPLNAQPEQPRTQALSTTRLAGGKTLVQAGHVSPRFWEITKFLHKGGGLSFILPI